MKFMTWLTYAITTICLLLASTLAHAAEGQQSAWQLALSWLLPIVGSIITAVVGALLAALLRRWGIKADQELLNKAVGTAVHFAEGKALAKLNNGGGKTDGAKKLEMALNVASELVAHYKLKKLARDKLTSLIEAKLGEHKVEEKKQLLKAKVKDGDKEAPAIKIPKWAV